MRSRDVVFVFVLKKKKNEGKERKPGMLAQACVPSTGEAEAEALKMPGQPEM